LPGNPKRHFCDLCGRAFVNKISILLEVRKFKSANHFIHYFATYRSLFKTYDVYIFSE